jgi:hypothetical protein
LVSLGFALAAGEAGRTGTISTRINVQLSVPSCDVNEAVKLGGELKTVIDFRIFLGTESDGVLGTAHVTALTSFTTATGVSTGNYVSGKWADFAENSGAPPKRAGYHDIPRRLHG